MIKPRKLQVKVEAVENPECAGETGAKSSNDSEDLHSDTKLDQFLKEALQESVSQCKERMVRFLLENRRIKEERETEETLVQKVKELEEEKRRLIVQTKQKLRRKNEEIKELRKELNILEGEKNKMEAENEVLSQVNIKLLSENENLQKELSSLRTNKELESPPAPATATAPNPDPAINFTRKRVAVTKEEANIIPEKEIKLENEELNNITVNDDHNQSERSLEASTDARVFFTLYIPFDTEDCQLSSKLEEDIAWYEPPVSVLPILDPTAGSVLEVKMKTKDLASAAFLALKDKYPGLQLSKGNNV